MIKIDAVQHRFDTNETMFLKRQLESIEGKIYEFKQRELKYRNFIPVSNRDNPGAETITYRMLRKVGMAKIVANYAKDLPRADAYMTEYTQKVKTIASSVGYNTQEIRAAQMANVPLDIEKSSSMRRAIRELENSICWAGDTETGIIGILNNTNIPTLAAAAGVGGTTWALKTAQEIIVDVRTVMSQVRQQSNGIHEVNTILMPRAQYDLIEGLLINTTTTQTVLQFLKSVYPNVTFDVLETELDSAFTGGTEDGLFAYEKDADVLEQRIPLELTLLPIEARGLELMICGEARNGGVVVRYPLAMTFFTGI